jgi:hypothetical protein
MGKIQTVNAVKENGRNLSKFGYILDEIIDVLNKLQQWQIFHVNRDANCDARGFFKYIFLVLMLFMNVKKKKKRNRVSKLKLFYIDM